MVGLINFYFSSGMLSLFVDSETEDGTQAKTFRGGFINHNDVWNVGSQKYFITFC